MIEWVNSASSIRENNGLHKLEERGALNLTFFASRGIFFVI
jgi:hypothetical protein